MRVVLPCALLLLLLLMLGVAMGQPRPTSQEDIEALPDCDDRLVESRPRSAVGDAAFEWFCPYFFPWKDITAYSLKGGRWEYSLHSVGNQVTAMGLCGDLIAYNNYRNRVFTCMPWEVDPVLRRWQVAPVSADDVSDDGKFVGREKTGMWHLHAQFASFAAVRQWYDRPANDQVARVPRCERSEDGIRFSGVACWHDDGEAVALKPWYKFKVRRDGNREFCELSSSKGSEASYRAEKLTYVARPGDVDRAITRCRFYVANQNQDKFDFDIANDNTGGEWKFKDIDFQDYKLDFQSQACPDAVTEACVDNAFSFYAKECMWVRKASRATPAKIRDMLGFVAPVDGASFASYADNGHYVLNLGQRNIEAWLNGAHWTGDARYIDTSTASLYFTEKPNFSCSGCSDRGWALAPAANADTCGVPQACVECRPWQRVDTPWRGAWSRCAESFAVRKCADCAAHHVRSAAETERADETCEPCPPLTPRRVGQAECEKCNHTQWFDAATPLGCAWFVSVMDGLSFTSVPRFNPAYVDRYRPPGSVATPEPVPALHYRSLVSDGEAWTTSTVAEKCPATSFAVLNASAARVFARNIYPRRVQFRRWCGHAEILKADDALVQPLDCGSRRSASDLRLADLISGAAGAYELAKERRLVANRMAEIKLTMLSDRFTCFYELRREGRAEDCTSCAGTRYAKDCGPTYFAELDAPAVAGPGTCEECMTQCSIVTSANSYFAVTQFSCWSNGTARVQGASSAGHGSLKLIKDAMSTSMNYWYKPAACVPCAGLSDAAVPQIVTRCGNKVSFETWDPTLELPDEAQVARPQSRFCCALDRNSNAGTICRPTENELGLKSATPLCETVVPDLQTEYANFCPPNWFLDRTGGCAGTLNTWKRTCCKKCELCQGAGKFKTDTYRQCSGGTDYDTQLKGCVASCAEKNYEFNGTCVACESCA